jgi:hypothetical protein
MHFELCKELHLKGEMVKSGSAMDNISQAHILEDFPSKKNERERESEGESCIHSQSMIIISCSFLLMPMSTFFSLIFLFPIKNALFLVTNFS